jgi:hypothetical protein
VCHNDVELSNVVFRDGIAVALIDFEFAAPSSPVCDLAQLARLCVSIEDDFDQARMGWQPADGPARLRLVAVADADADGLDRDGRAELIAAIDDAIDRVEEATRRSVEEGGAQAIAVLSRRGGIENTTVDANGGCAAEMPSQPPSAETISHNAPFPSAFTATVACLVNSRTLHSDTGELLRARRRRR